MTTETTNRITKDTSARKSSSILSNVEARAEVAKYQFIINGLQEDYEKQVDELIAAQSELRENFDAQLERMAEELKDAHKAEILTLKAQSEAAINKTQEGNVAKTAQLDKKVSEWERKYVQLQKDSTKKLEGKDAEIKSAKDQLERKTRAYESQVKSKESQIEELKQKVAIEIVLKCRGVKARKYLRHSSSSFEEVVKDLRNDVPYNLEDTQFFTSDHEPTLWLKHASNWEGTPGIRKLDIGTKTLEELGIKDGAAIWFNR